MPKVGSQSPQAKLSGVWKAWTNCWAKHSGSWKKPLSVHVKSGGSWVKVWDERPVLTITNNTRVITGTLQDPYTTFTTYFTVEANGFNTTITCLENPNGYPTGVLTVSSVSANDTVTGSASVTVNQYLSQDPISQYDFIFAPIQASNSSGSVTKQYYN